MGYLRQHPFYTQDALGAAKSTIGRRRLGVGFQTVAFNPGCRQQIGIISMQHGPVGHRDGQIQRPAAAGILHKFNTNDPAFLVIAHMIIDPEIVTLAGDDHIVIAVIAHFARLACSARRHRTTHSQCIALAFFAAKTAAHAPDFDPNCIHRHAQGMGHLMLYFGWVLGRGMYQHVAIFLGQSQCCLTL